MHFRLSCCNTGLDYSVQLDDPRGVVPAQCRRMPCPTEVSSWLRQINYRCANRWLGLLPTVWQQWPMPHFADLEILDSLTEHDWSIPNKCYINDRRSALIPQPLTSWPDKRWKASGGSPVFTVVKGWHLAIPWPHNFPLTFRVASVATSRPFQLGQKMGPIWQSSRSYAFFCHSISVTGKFLLVFAYGTWYVCWMLFVVWTFTLQSQCVCPGPLPKASCFMRVFEC